MGFVLAQNDFVGSPLCFIERFTVEISVKYTYKIYKHLTNLVKTVN